MRRSNAPEFAILGHPNEGKSSVVSTLVEDDSVRISPTPGETMECRDFPVIIDGIEIIRFIDTPGFQNPRQTLSWMKKFQGSGEDVVNGFIRAHRNHPAFKIECELFAPVAEGAGIIFVADGSRPLRNVDRTEMEILRLTGRPRMAIINNKDEDTTYLQQWKNEFRRHFNAIRVFNAHRATYAERIALLESLKSIDQDWESALTKVISAFQKDWAHRNDATVEILLNMFAESLQLSISRNFTDPSDEPEIKRRLHHDYSNSVKSIEKDAHQKIRKLFKQNIFNYDLPAHSILREDLFSEQTWQALGLSARQLITTAGLAGGAVGAAIDVAAAGLTFGIFTAIGSAVGAGLAAFGGGKRLAQTKISGLKLGGRRITIGPNENIQFLYILIDRSLLFYSHVINWAHGRRDYPTLNDDKHSEPVKKGFATGWNDNEKKIARDFFEALRNKNEREKEKSRKELGRMLKQMLWTISKSDHRSDWA